MRHNYLMGCDVVVGADKGHTDKATVKSVQSKLKALAAATHNSSFDPGPIDGIVGAKTRAAVAAFNKAFGWPTDGSTITDGTLTALARPDVTDPAGYAAQQAALDDANSIASSATSTTTASASPFSPSTFASSPGSSGHQLAPAPRPLVNGYEMLGAVLGGVLLAGLGALVFRKHAWTAAAIGGTVGAVAGGFTIGMEARKGNIVA